MRRLDHLATGDWQPAAGGPPGIEERVATLARYWLDRGRPASRRSAVLFVPGRIELLGKHTDYAGGRSLTVATRQGLCLLVTPQRQALLRLEDHRRGETVEIALDGPVVDRGPGWGLYPRTLVQRVAEAFGGPLSGGEALFDSDLPTAAGLSSSSALVVATYLALEICADLRSAPTWQEALPTGESLAAFLGAVEGGRAYGPWSGHGGVGTRGGDQDHIAILCSRPRAVGQYRYLPATLERSIDWPPGWALAVAVSGVRAAKTAAALRPYNEAVESVRQLEELWAVGQGRSPATLGAIVRAGSGAVKELSAAIEAAAMRSPARQRLEGRLRQFHEESEIIVPAVGDLLERRVLSALGDWTDRSMRLASDWLQNQVPETIWLTAAARERGAVAASAFGAGFGGAVWAMVRRDQVEGFLEDWSRGYSQRFPQHRQQARVLWTEAGAAAGEL